RGASRERPGAGQRGAGGQALRSRVGPAVSELPAPRRARRGPAGRVPRRDPGQLRSGDLDRRDRALPGRALHRRAAAGQVPVQVSSRGGEESRSDVVNLGQLLSWLAFLASLAAGLGFMAAAGGREGALRPARAAFRLMWLALALATAFLWRILFTHQF